MPAPVCKVGHRCLKFRKFYLELQMRKQHHVGWREITDSFPNHCDCINIVAGFSISLLKEIIEDFLDDHEFVLKRSQISNIFEYGSEGSKWGCCFCFYKYSRNTRVLCNFERGYKISGNLLFMNEINLFSSPVVTYHSAV